MTTTVEPTAARKVPLKKRKPLGLIIVAIVAALIALSSLGMYSAGTLEELAESGVGLAGAYADAPAVIQAALYIHIVTASLALLVGPSQFIRSARRRWPRAHRVAGRVYLVSVATASIAALIMAPFNSAGIVGMFGFGVLAALWLYTGLRAYRAIRALDLANHEAWMIRNYALTFAAPTLRLWLFLLIMIQMVFTAGDPDFDAIFANAYAVVPFLCWIPNLVFAEWLVRRRGLPSYRITPSSIRASGL